MSVILSKIKNQTGEAIFRLRGMGDSSGAPSNHIVIDHPAVSAQHAILARVADSYRLNDLHSTNGTQVNGVSITDTELKDGDKIRFGSVVAVFAGPLT
jgi:pSer/pThr/pTyr-binding forkhead associated (FHA) protein